MKVVLDTNIVVSAFLSPAGKPAHILSLVLSRKIGICFNTAILAEYEEVLCRSKFAGRIHKSSIRRFFEILHSVGSAVEASISKLDLPDETDRKFYDVATAAGAILVTGNKKHYPDEAHICDPAEFLEKIIVS